MPHTCKCGICGNVMSPVLLQPAQTALDPCACIDGSCLVEHLARQAYTAQPQKFGIYCKKGVADGRINPKTGTGYLTDCDMDETNG
jgi:hypothetical protein